MMEIAATPYKLPEVENHSFFYIDQRVTPEIEAKLHHHDAWELYYVIKGNGKRMVGDTLQPFAEGDVALMPPSIHHQWEYDPASVGSDGNVCYLMVAFSHKFVENCIAVFPELRNRLSAIDFPTEAMNYGAKTASIIRKAMTEMSKADEVGRLSIMINLLTIIFTPSDFSFAGRPVRIEKDVRRIQHIAEYVMAHYIHEITLDEISKEVGMNRSAFCSYFKKHKGMTFFQFVMNYRLNTARELLLSTDRQVSDICFSVGFNDIPHFVRTFSKTFGESPAKYRKSHRQ